MGKSLDHVRSFERRIKKIRRQIEGDDADLSGVKLAAELEPVARAQTRQSVDLLDEQDVSSFDPCLIFLVID